ncbi:MAG TPA: hypothetical protein VL003_08125 [Pusillimonas sp.]|uniref:hypothetical protein n=1 Tax=Pusillimonas sp. TaxID=3040095 RepID=UPI002CF231FD|nr:hypothetical protein [Pusillimonas sp.]HUH88008.1 hypothetical protein [Pusillimonas sp.]
MNDTLRLILFCGAGAWAFMSLYQDFKDPVRRRRLLKIIYVFSALWVATVAFLISSWWTAT